MRTLTLILFCGLLLNACMYSEQAFYKQKDLIQPANLEGEWLATEKKQDKSQKMFITVRKAEKGNSYTFFSRTEEKNTKSDLDTIPDLHFFKADEQLYLDALVKSTDSTGQKHIGHLLFKLDVKKEKIIFYSMNEKFIRKQLQEKKLDISYRQTQDDLILTASTADLQAFVRKNARMADFFEKGGELERVKPKK